MSTDAYLIVQLINLQKIFFFFFSSNSSRSPFYGYHQKEHQYLKIYLYNPAMVRRTANLLQNGAILNRVYQPHESHLPHILQFMIDYNLYGMSFLYVPSTVIRYRRQQPDAVAAAAVGNVVDEDEFENCDSPLRSSDADGRQWLDKKVERMTTSANEIDIEAAFILNRFQIAQHENAEHANPGIAFIWSDERGRRNKMNGTVSSIGLCERNQFDFLFCHCQGAAVAIESRCIAESC